MSLGSKPVYPCESPRNQGITLLEHYVGIAIPAIMLMEGGPKTYSMVAEEALKMAQAQIAVLEKVKQ